jgi:hypothetical protein
LVLLALVVRSFVSSAHCTLHYTKQHNNHRSSAGLLPLFNAAAGYMRDKVSSSVLASLSAGAPLLAPPGLLEAHEFLSRDAVLPMVRCVISVYWCVYRCVFGFGVAKMGVVFCNHLLTTVCFAHPPALDNPPPPPKKHSTG